LIHRKRLSGGHNAGVVWRRPASTGTHTYQVSTKAEDDPYIGPDEWLHTAIPVGGSWWPVWTKGWPPVPWRFRAAGHGRHGKRPHLARCAGRVRSSMRWRAVLIAAFGKPRHPYESPIGWRQLMTYHFSRTVNLPARRRARHGSPRDDRPKSISVDQFPLWRD
jgi:hypothetical protein